jgi:hypothetical protein
MSIPLSNTLVCSICYGLIEIESTKTDENGKPVHEDCYSRRLLGIAPRSTRSTAHPTRKKKLPVSLPNDIVIVLRGFVAGGCFASVTSQSPCGR